MASGQSAIASPKPHQNSVEQFKYSNRVVLKSILGRSDAGLGLAGQRVVVGGWVKSFKEKPHKDATRAPAPAPAAVVPASRDLTCFEVLVSRTPFRIFARLVGKEVSSPPRRPPQPPPQKQQQQQQQPEIVDVAPAPATAQTSVAYLRVNDGSCVANLQVVADSKMPLARLMAVGVSILVEGVLEQRSEPGKQFVELNVEKILYVGVVDSKNYPLANQSLSLETIRPFPHLRVRTTTVASITRIRSAISHATQEFFQKIGFIHVHMPIITTTNLKDCSKMFQVTTLFNKTGDMEKLSTVNDREAVNIEVVKAAIREKSSRIEELKRSNSNKEVLLAALQDLQKANELALQLGEQQRSTAFSVGKMDFSKDFFSCEAYLSMSARLHLESYACGLSSVYTVGPVFQANDPPSKKQLAEMWMVEVELAFAELEDVMKCAEEFLKFLCQSILENCPDDIKFLSRKIDKNSTGRLHSFVSTSFARITYVEAVEHLKKVADETFKTKVEWGVNLSDEHKRYLAEEIFKQPIIVYDYPKELKPFYVSVKNDGRTVSAFDIIAPKGAVLIRGSQKEERMDIITSRIQELGLPKEQYEWYLDLRRHGTVKHSGFSIAIEDLLMFAVGLEDIQDAIPFPRTSGHISA